ncbi:nucleotidyltransferase family protein [Microbacterium fluvii]|uniref:Nucleotidyltransferase family protein n=1 Tax=Microbacterium fluvii TaxID=415215 RepID=A0ABW2HBX5_9MICO|nr:nucleotidyltransferase family protein [Microbacterium fluvii]MCU4671150.1 nucleotidyltransferase family protein [Microbacterium fluvii]
MPDSILQLAEADALASAWVQHLADERGIRMLLIKGASLSHHGLRDPRTSADVDALIEPGRFDELCDAILAEGWRKRPDILISRLTTLHSRTFLRDGWPCDLDVHSFFPGFLADPADVFDALWVARERLDFAHRTCDIPGRAASILILALHSLRGTRVQRRHVDELEHLVRLPLSAEEIAEIGALARVTGCVATLESVLPRLGVHVEPTEAELASTDLHEWRERVDSGWAGAYMWTVALRRSPWRERPRILWTAFWPSDRDLLLSRPEVQDRPAHKLLARILRWGRGVKSLPRTARAIWHNRSH